MVQELECAAQRAFDAARAAEVTDHQLDREIKKLERVQENKKDRAGHDR